MSSRAPATVAAPRGGDGGAADHLWAKAAELERDFAGYKRRLAERRQQAAAADVAGCRAEEERGGGGDDAAAGRGPRYEEYVRRRDERLRHEWRARMERKEAEMQALWARLDRAGSRGRRGGDGELAAATASSNAGQDHGSLRQKPTNLEVKVRPTAPVTPRCGVPSSPATKLSRPRTSMPSTPAAAAAAASPRLSTPDPRRRPSHLHREQPQAAEPPATLRKENRLPPPPTTAKAASPATPRPRTMLSRSRSLFKDRGSSAVTARESPRPSRLQPPRSSYDGASNAREPVLAPSPPHADAIAVTRSNSCSNGQAVLGDLEKASAVAPEPFRLGRSGNGGVEAVSSPQVIPRDEPGSSEVAPAGDRNADRKSYQEHVDQSSDKVGSVEITGDSDTEPSYVYIKKDSGEQTPRPCQASTGLGTCPVAEPRSDSKDSDDNADDTMESTGSNDLAGETTLLTDAEDASRRESSESLYSNVQSSFSPRSELDTSATGSPLPSITEQSPESYASPRPRKQPEGEDAEKSMPMPTTPRSSVTVSITVQSPMDAVTGLKRLLTFGRKNSKGSEAPTAAVVERTPRSMAPESTPPADGCMSGEWSAGDSVKARLDSSDVASSDDLDSSYVISPHVWSLQSYPANPGLKEPALHAQSPRVHRSFFSFSSFKSRAI